MNHEILEALLEELENVYGDLDNDCGCYDWNGTWLSIYQIVKLIKKVDEEWY